ncbi:MAG TPA: extracellular solute-binding protein [Clostridia bacterium]|nr:extracellular solute-binding protein [Clostridia bacterium]
MKRFALILMALVLVLSAAACGPGSSTTDNTARGSSPAGETSAATASGSSLPALSPDSPVTLSAWLTSTYAAPAADNKLTKLLRDKLGVTINYEIITPDNADQKTGVMLAGGEYPDLVGATDLNGRFITGKALIPLDDYLTPDKADLLFEHVRPYWNRLATDAGNGAKHIYILPYYNRYYGEITGGTNYGASGFWIQKALLADQNYPDLSNMTLEKYFKMIEDYKTKYPTIDGQPTIGFEILAVTGREWGMTNPPEYLAGAPNNGGVIVDSNNVATIFGNKDIAKRYYQFMNQMNARGLVDVESFTQTLDQYLAKLATGRVLGMYDQRWNFVNANDALVSQKKDERTWVSTMPTYDGIAPYYADRDVMNINQGFGVSVSCRQPEFAVSFLNTMLSEEWQKILNWGIEGEDYSVGADGKFTRTPEQREQQKDLVWRSSNKLEALNDLLPKHQGSYSDGNAYSPDTQPAEFFITLSEYDKNFLTKYGKQTWRDFLNQPPENPLYYPCWNITLPDGSDAQAAGTQLSDTALQYLPKVILASPGDFESIWREYTDAIAGINTKAIEDVINRGIQDRLANWGGSK